MRGRAVGLAVALVSGVLLGTAGPAQAGPAPEFRYEVGYNGSRVIRSIPGTQVTFTAATGQKRYFSSRALTAELLTSGPGANDAPGTTFIVHCAGPNMTDGRQRGVYWAENMATPGETRTSGLVRWLFIAPADGTFTCELQVSSYVRNDVIDRFGTLQWRILPGAELISSPVGEGTVITAARWALPSKPVAEQTILRGGTHRTGGYTHVLSTAGTWVTVVQDVNLTTCHRADIPKFPGCDEAPAYNGSTVETWIEAQPQHRDGSSCGTLRKGPVTSTFISVARHHKTVTNTWVPAKSLFGGCPQVRLSVQVRHVGGAPTILHSNWVNAIAPTHGVVYQH
ncbi:hypothetical protein HPO96_12715 [Kribbella sandramycini]|uniref:Uncharacterized protein n=1 Tax=Kribbella sandramycini TaxID=60450 RepID=A0A7Y4NZ05_9ACTN|nr:hypothetical protein [Kribbella sandramycini]MBB6569050.1 hypothetical protein [Kribbella sandramycini]NOL41106.1 hypothetical protein [Kribbella sandramycini]